jgi:predicted RNase H-like HicB family nuclease
MPYKAEDYNCHVKWSDEDEAYVATVEELPFTGRHADTSEEALALLHEAIQGDLDDLVRSNEYVPPPFKLRPTV